MRIYIWTILAATLVVALAIGQSPAHLRALQETAAAFDLEETTIRALIQDQQSGRRTARQITSAYLARIEALDRSGPALHSVIELNPDALSIADALDAERVAGHLRGPLHGIPVLIKDNIDTADRMMTTAGSLALEGSIAARDAVHRRADARRRSGDSWQNQHERVGELPVDPLDERLERPRRPGEESRTRSTATHAGRARERAQPLPRISRRSVSGRKPTDRLSCPSGATALVGIKPTLGLVSRSGIIPLAHSQDTAGPMARTVEDAAVLLAVLAGADPRDSATDNTRRPATTGFESRRSMQTGFAVRALAWRARSCSATAT